jgi:hypothetical protein
MVDVSKANINMVAMSRDVDALRRTGKHPADLGNFFRGRLWSTLESLERHAKSYFATASRGVTFKRFPLTVIGVELDTHDDIADSFEAVVPLLFPRDKELQTYAQGMIDQWRAQNTIAVAPTHIARYVTMERGREMGKRFAIEAMARKEAVHAA